MKKFLVPALFLIITSCSMSGQIESIANRTTGPGPGNISQEIIDLHKRLIIADLHSDALLWERDLLKKNSRGHVDIPRLVEGNVALQSFTIVSNYPFLVNTGCNFAFTDVFCCLTFLQGLPFKTAFSSRERALYQIKKLHDAEKRSGGKFFIIRTGADLDDYLTMRKKNRNIAAGFIGLEGAYPLQGKAENLQKFFDAGVRMIGMTHFPDSPMSGSVHGFSKGGLSPEGRRLVKKMQDMGIIIDLSHASRAAIRDILEIAKKPVIFSHTGLRGVCDNNRNITDDEIRGIKRNGGVIGVAFFEKATCGRGIDAIIDSIEYVIKIAGIDHVALGSDFDGGVATPVDSSGLILITEALVKRGYSGKDIAKIMGGNAVRVLRESLP
jgi:microsomal dipeptidase-like Zn-dependent dipeptidase